VVPHAACRNSAVAKEGISPHELYVSNGLKHELKSFFEGFVIAIFHCPDGLIRIACSIYFSKRPSLPTSGTKPEQGGI
jgi:hypothetical protein